MFNLPFKPRNTHLYDASDIRHTDEKASEKMIKKIIVSANKTYLDPYAGHGQIICDIIKNLLNLDVPTEKIVKNCFALEENEHLCNRIKLNIRALFGSYDRKICLDDLNKIVYNYQDRTKLIEEGIIYEATSQKEIYEQRFKVHIDFVLTNPPYKAGLHLKFLQNLTKQFPDARVIFLHPSDWLVQKRKDSKNYKLYNSLKEELSLRGTNTEFIDNPWGFKQVQLILPLCITDVDNTGKVSHVDNRTKIYGEISFSPVEHKINHLNDITQWYDGKIEYSILEKVFAYAKQNNWKEKKNITHPKNYYVSLMILTGNGNTDIEYLDGKKRKISNIYSIGNNSSLKVYDIPQKAKPQQGKKEGGDKPCWSFANEEEAQNAIDFVMKTKFMRAYLALIKPDQNAMNNLSHLIPYFDFTQSWNDEKIAQFFQFSDEENTIIDKIVEAISK